MTYQDLREWIARVDELGELLRVDGADRDLEIGAVTQLAQIATDNESAPAVLFDNVPGFEPGYRVLSSHLASLNRFALTTRLPLGLPRNQYVNAWLEHYRTYPTIPTRQVTSGPVMEVQQVGEDVDLGRFPVPKWYEKDGGYYIGTGSATITRDPDDGWVNLGTYRVMVLDRNRLTFYMAPGRHGNIHRQKWFEHGKPCPVAISVGHDPLIFLVSSTELPYGLSEYEVAGGIRGEPVEVIEAPLTGLPVPAHAEIVIEGESLPGETATEGPFGEWTGYYGSGARGEPVIHVKAIYHRRDPIILGAPGLRPPKGLALHSQILRSSHILESMRQAGVPGVTGVWCHQAGGGYLFTAVAIKQMYPGHARQAGHVAAFCRGGAYMGRFTVVVDDDIDVTDLGHVVWAMSTRCDPAQDIETAERCWSGPLDPIIHPDHKGFNSRAIVDACRPWEWRDRFPDVVDLSPELREAMLAKFGDQLRAKAMRARA